jgi:hypothetical protein
MPFIPKVPASCADLDLALVERTLAKHFGDIVRAAEELGVSGSDLRRLTWAKPKLLEAAHEEMAVVVAIADGLVIRALDSPDPRRRERAADRIMSSWIARDHPLAPARHGSRGVGAGPLQRIVFRWESEGAPDGFDADLATDILDRDGELVRSAALTERPVEPAARAEPALTTPSPPPLPKWLGHGGPPPLVAHLYQPWTSPQPPPQPRRERERESEDPPQPRPWRRMSRGGYR